MRSRLAWLLPIYSALLVFFAFCDTFCAIFAFFRHGFARFVRWMRVFNEILWHQKIISVHFPRSSIRRWVFAGGRHSHELRRGWLQFVSETATPTQSSRTSRVGSFRAAVYWASIFRTSLHRAKWIGGRSALWNEGRGRKGRKGAGRDGRICQV